MNSTDERYQAVQTVNNQDSIEDVSPQRTGVPTNESPKIERRRSEVDKEESLGRFLFDSSLSGSSSVD